MKFSVAKDTLDRHLQYVGRIVAVRNSLPVLSNILLETDNGLLRMSATDLELAITTHMPAKIEQEGAFTVPARIFQEFVHQNPDETIEFNLESFELIGKGSKVTGRISGIDADEFPALPKVEKGTVVRLPYAPLVESLKKVVIACAADLSRPVLTAIYLSLNEDTATIVATDSFRLVERKIKIVPVQEPISVLIPGRTVQELVRLQASFVNEEDIEVEITDQQALFRIGDVELVSRLVVGSFPKYSAIVPTVFPTTVDVTTSDLVQALRLSYVFSQGGIANVMVEVDAEGNFSVSSYGSQRGSTKHTVYALVEEGFEPIQVAFNAKYLLDACSATGSPHVKLHISGKTKATVITTEEENYMQLVMPIRLDS